MPQQHPDLDTVLGFVTRRIENEAVQSGDPLTDEERFKLNRLPTHPGPNSSAFFGFDPQTGGSSVIIRDFVYERLCALARAAYQADVRVDPSSAYRWEFAAAVSKLNGHPVNWLLQWAGVKVVRPWWDRWMLVGGALSFIFIGFVLMVFFAMEPASPLLWILAGAGMTGMLVGLHFVSRRTETWHLKQTIEKCRRCLTFDTVS
jgi:hypothetical protein